MSSIRIFPFEGFINPTRLLKVVVFPHPEGPRRVKNSPSYILIVKSGMAMKSPNFISIFLKSIIIRAPFQKELLYFR